MISFEYTQYILSFMVRYSIKNLLWLQHIGCIKFCVGRWIKWISGWGLDYSMNTRNMCWCWWQASASAAPHFSAKVKNKFAYKFFLSLNYLMVITKSNYIYNDFSIKLNGETHDKISFLFNITGKGFSFVFHLCQTQLLLSSPFSLLIRILSN